MLTITKASLSDRPESAHVDSPLALSRSVPEDDEYPLPSAIARTPEASRMYDDTTWRANAECRGENAVYFRKSLVAFLLTSPCRRAASWCSMEARAFFT